MEAEFVQVSARPILLDGDKKRGPSRVTARPRRPFIFGAGTARRDRAQPGQPAWKTAKPGTALHRSPAHSGKNGAVSASASTEKEPELADTFEALVRLAREAGQLSYDDINELLPEGVSADALDELYLKLNNSGIHTDSWRQKRQACNQGTRPRL